MAEKVEYLIFDGLALGAEPATVELADGVPRAWRLLKLGANHLVQRGVEMVLTLTAEMRDAIVRHYQTKGEKLPIDSRHALYLAAEKFGCSEGELARLLPFGTATLGWGALAARPDGLWVEDVTFIPLAAEVVRAGMLKYYSPVVRGLDDGSPRVTSVALDNVPALNNLNVIAASAEAAVPNKQEVRMTRTEEALGRLLNKTGAVALGAETDEACAGEIDAAAGKVKSAEALLAVLKEVLALGDDVVPEVLRDKLKALIADAQAGKAAGAAVEQVALAAEVQRGLAAGKLSNAMLEVEPFKAMSADAMRKYLEIAPVVVPLGAEHGAPTRTAVAALSAEQSKILDSLGITGDARKKVEEGLKNG